MAKKASTKSRKSTSSAAASGEEPENGKLVLKIKSAGRDPKSVSNSKKKKKKKKKSAKVDANKPKKPPTAFFYFLEDFRKEFQAQNPDVKSMRYIGKACGEKWNTMTYEVCDSTKVWCTCDSIYFSLLNVEKVQYYDIATEKRAEFDMAMAEYNKRMENGENQQSEDSEFNEYDQV